MQGDPRLRHELSKALGRESGTLADYLKILAGARGGDPASQAQWAAIELADPGAAHLAQTTAKAYAPVTNKSAGGSPPRPRRKNAKRARLVPKSLSTDAEFLAALQRNSGYNARQITKSAAPGRHPGLDDPDFAEFIERLGPHARVVMRGIR